MSEEVASPTRVISIPNEPKITPEKPDLVSQTVSPIISTTNGFYNNSKRVISRGISVVTEGIPISEFKEYVKNSFANGGFAKQHKVRSR